MKNYIILMISILMISNYSEAKKELDYTNKIVTVTLNSGAKITATLLRKNNQNLILDCGYDVLTVPNAQVVELKLLNTTGKVAKKENKGVYQTGRLQADSIPNLVKTYGDSVFMIKTSSALGSGFFISKDGYLITNYHVVERETNISISIFIKRKNEYEKHDLKKVKIIALQPLRDLALLKIDPKELKELKIKPLTLSNQDDLKVGNLIFAVGNPLGLERSVTQGIVSSTTRIISGLRFIQTDVAINPGNSGGPLFNTRGEVVGVACAGFTNFNGLAFGIPVVDLINFLEHRQAYLYDESRPENGVHYLQPPYLKTKTNIITKAKE